MQQRIHGESGVTALATKSSLATVYEAVEEYDLAMQLHEDVLTHYQTQLAESDARLATGYQKLGLWYLANGRRNEVQEEFTKASELLSEAVRLYQQNRGEDHTDTLDAKFALAQAQVELRQLEKAQRILEDLDARFEKLREPSDRLALEAKNTLGWVYLNQNSLAAAEYILATAYEQLRGNEDNFPLAVQVMGNLAITRYRMGKLAEAVVVDERTLEKATKILGAKDVEAGAARARLILAYQELGRPEDAGKIEALILQMESSRPNE